MASALPVIPPAGLAPLSAPPSPALAPRLARVAYLEEAIDPVTGEVLAVSRGAHPVDVAFLRQLRTRAGSGAALGQGGSRFHLITKNLDSTPLEIRHEVNRIAKPFVDRGDITILSVRIEVENDAAYVVIDYRNERLGKSKQGRVSS